ncbi:MAG: hypothetical protein WC717_02615 [Candidatus Micrarchaeia archaeon]|jgi:hypothetical protein
MRTVNIERTPKSGSLASFFKKDLLRAEPSETTVYVIHFKGMYAPPVADLKAIDRLERGIVIANVLHPVGYLNGRRVNYIQITSNQGDLFSKVILTAKPLSERSNPRIYDFASFSDGKKRYSMAVQDVIAVNRIQLSAEIASIFPFHAKRDAEYFGLTLVGGTTCQIFEKNSSGYYGISVPYGYYNKHNQAMAGQSLETLISPVLDQLSGFAKLLGAGWMAERINDLQAQVLLKSVNAELNIDAE